MKDIIAKNAIKIRKIFQLKKLKGCKLYIF